MLATVEKFIGKFIALPPEELAALTQAMEMRTYDKKVRLIDLNETEQYFHFIVKGLVRKYFYKGKEEIITQLAQEGELVSSSVSFFSGEPSGYIVETIEPTTFLSLRKDHMEELYIKYPRIQKLGRLVITELFLQKEYWELERIRYNTKERFVRFMEANPQLFQRVPQKYLASYLHVKPETFSRLKHLLLKKVEVSSKK